MHDDDETASGRRPNDADGGGSDRHGGVDQTPPQGDSRGGDSTATRQADLSAPLSGPVQGAASAGPTLALGEVVAGRFEITRFVARGGMGEVYEARDLDLGTTVAVKIMRPETAGDPTAVERLKREIQLARQVTHRSVCRIFDVFHHRTTDSHGHEHEITGFTMEMLEGETLAQRLNRRGAISPDEALPLIRQIADALATAHQVGIVHRDLKSSNVMLVPDGEHTRVVVTDFGLARAVGSEADLMSLTGPDSIVGTLAYMAPEQLEGEEATAAADIYALGTVIYEMVTGNRPFKGRTAISNAIRRLQEAPPSPRIHVPELGDGWDRTILRCLERRPEDRFASAAQIVPSLTGEIPVRRPPSRRWRTWAVALAAALLIAGGLVLVERRNRVSPAATGAPRGDTVASRPSVAILGFRNLTGNSKVGWLSTALSEMLITELAAGGELQTVPGETVARMKVELALPETESYAPDTLATIRRILGSDYVVLGSFFAGGSDGDSPLRVNIRIQDAASGETVAAVTDTRPGSELLTLVSDTGERLRAALGLDHLSSTESTELQAALPATTSAARWYAQGLERLRRFDALAARELLEEAVAADPSFPLAHSALALAWSRLGYDGRAQDSAREAFDLAARLPREERLWVEGQYREIAGEWARAIEIYELLFSFFPDRLEYGLRLANAQVAGGRGEDALATAARLGQLPPPRGEDPRISLAEANAAGTLSDYRRQTEAAARAIAASEVIGARLLVAEGRLEEGWAAWRMGEPGRARLAFEQAKAIYERAGDRGGVANCLRKIAAVLCDLGRMTEALAMTEESLAISRGIGARYGVGEALNTIADIISTQGDLNGATALYWQAHEIFTEIGNLSGVSQSLNNVAIIRWQEGNFEGALELYERSLDISRNMGDRSGVATCLNNIAVVLHDQGQLDAARTRYEEALAISREIGEPSGVATALNNLGELLRLRGELEAARECYEESLALRHAADDIEGIEVGLFNVAEVLREQSRLAEAQKRYAESLELCRRIGSGEDEALSRTRLGQVLLDAGRTTEAADSIETALAFARTKGTRAILANVLLAYGDLLLARDDLEGSVRALSESQRHFAAHGDLAGEAEALLALAAALLEQNEPAEARRNALQAQALFAGQHNRDREAQAFALAARAHLLAGETDAATEALGRATGLLASSQSTHARHTVAIHGAPVNLLLGAGNRSRQRIREVVAEARHNGHVRFELQGRIALARISLAEGEGATARSELATVAREAETRGLVRIAALAAAAVSPGQDG